MVFDVSGVTFASLGLLRSVATLPPWSTWGRW